MNFLEAVKKTGKAKKIVWRPNRWLMITKFHIENEMGNKVNLVAGTNSLMSDDWLPYHEPKPCEACELLESFVILEENTYMETKMFGVIRFLLKNPAVHDEGCKEAK